MREHLEAVRNKGKDTVPEPLRQRDKARAYYGVLSERLAEYVDSPDTLVATALETDAIIVRHKVRDWQHNKDAQNRMLNDLDDLFHDLKGERGVPIPYALLDEVTDKIMNIAKAPQG